MRAWRIETAVLVLLGAALAVAVVSDARHRAEARERDQNDQRALVRYAEVRGRTRGVVWDPRFSRAPGHDTVCASIGRRRPGGVCLQLGHRGDRVLTLGGWDTRGPRGPRRTRYGCFGLAARAGLCPGVSPRSARLRAT